MSEANRKPQSLKMFQDIDAAAATSGFSKYHLRQGIKNGSIPFVRVGNKHLINMVQFLRQLDALPDSWR